MLVYRTQREAVSPRRELQLLCQSNLPLDVLIRLGQIESAVLDVLCADRDLVHPVAVRLRDAVIAAARWCRGGDAALPWDRLFELDLPDRVDLTVPEGFAYYSLHPEMYVRAAERFFHAEHPRCAGVVGIRSIGTTLSAVVAARLEEFGVEVRSWTVRPRGHPFDRKIALSPEFERELLSFCDASFVIVDEGPGLSGSSMTCVADRLSALGISDERITLFPSWLPDGSGFRSESARRRWPRHRKYCAGFEEVCPPGDAIDLSAGKWRSYICGPEWPAVQPQHERRKYLSNGRLRKFAGLTRFGLAKLDLAARLHEAGFGPRPFGLRDGFLETGFVSGAPARAGSRPPLDAIARYLSFRRDHCPAARGASFDELTEMIELNSGGIVTRTALSQFRAHVEDSVPVAIDGRMLPHEWIETPAGWLKTDLVDHCDDHFLPGPQPIEWDVAGTIVEFDLDDGAAEFLARACGCTDALLRFYLPAYLSFRLGYAITAAEALAGTPDSLRFLKYGDRLRNHRFLSHSAQPHSPHADRHRGEISS